MKIIEKGTPKHERIWRGMCRSCGSVAEAKASELKNIIKDRFGSFSWEKCPVCGEGEKSLEMCFLPMPNGS
jgi:hypothetical protein